MILSPRGCLLVDVDSKCLFFERLLVQRAMKLLLIFSVFTHELCF